jgi:deoxyinosine 3'endonuclease (endonuclease V)
MQVVYEDYEMVRLTQPYVSGFLAFREVGFIQALVLKLRDRHPALLPQVRASAHG